MRFIKLFSMIAIVVLLQGCSNEPKVENGHLQEIKAQSSASTLYYTGNVKPLRSLVVTSPVDGVVVGMPTEYGQDVDSGNMIFTISSAKFLSDYKTALMQYIKAKNDFNNSKSQLSEGEFLHKNQLISDDDYKMKKSNYYSNRLVLLQAKDQLENLLRQLDVKNVNLFNLSIADIDKITKAMHFQKDSENLKILSPAQGVLLAPTKNHDDSKKVMKGDSIKQGDVLAVIGDMSGISVKINVNEMTVNQLQVGQKVKVTGIAFPDYILNGKISRVDRQGESTSNGVPYFEVEVSVPTLTQAERRDIHVGMSAKVEINLNEASRIMIPITAILEKNGGSYVKAYDRKSGKIKDVFVQTGKSTPDSVAILSGLHNGDKIVIPN